MCLCAWGALPQIEKALTLDATTPPHPELNKAFAEQLLSDECKY